MPVSLDFKNLFFKLHNYYRRPVKIA